MANNFGRVNVSVTASTGGLTAGLANASKQTSKFAAQIGRISLATTFLAAERAVSVLSSTVRSAYGSMRGFVDAAVSLGEETSKSAVVFGRSADAVARFAKSAKGIGISEAAALQATGTFGNLFRAIGLSQEQSSSYSVTLTSLAADLASFNNATIGDALMALGAGLRGEAEPLRRFGVLLDDATLRQNALAMGLTTSLKTVLTPSQKAQAAYNAILRQTTLAQGDFTRTSGSLANQQRILSANFANLSAKLGAAFLPLFQKVTKALIDAVPAIQAMVSQITDFLTGTTTGFDNAIVSANSLTEAIKRLATEAQRLKGFAEISVSGVGAVGAGGLMILEDLSWLVGLQEFSEKVGKEARVWDIATQMLSNRGQQNFNRPGQGFNAAMARAQRDAAVPPAMNNPNNAGSVVQSIAGVMDTVRQYGATALTLTREAALGFTRAALGGLNQQAQQSARASSESLQAIVLGTASGESFINRIRMGFDPRRVEGDASRTANATEAAASTLNSIEQLFNRLDLGLASIEA